MSSSSSTCWCLRSLGFCSGRRAREKTTHTHKRMQTHQCSEGVSAFQYAGIQCARARRGMAQPTRGAQQPTLEPLELAERQL
eukprot:11629681-Alexandrium_andersonii.AAC.1